MKNSTEIEINTMGLMGVDEWRQRNKFRKEGHSNITGS